MAFYPPSNYITLTLDTTAHPSGLGTGDLTITVNEDISTLQTQGWLNLDRALPGSREIVKWTSYDSGTKTFTVLRGQDGTTAHTHTTTCTITISAVKAYWDSMKSYVDTLFTAPPAIGSTTPAAATFTTLTTTGAVAIGGAVTTSLTTGTVVNMSPTLTGNYSGIQSYPTISSGSHTVQGFIGGATVSGGTPSIVTGHESSAIVSGGTLTDFFGLNVTGSVSGGGALTNRYIIRDGASFGTNQFFMYLGYASGGVLSGATTHDTESDELKVNHNGTTKYIKLYV